MADALGFMGKMGLAAAAAWDSAYSATGMAVIPFMSESLTPSWERIADQALVGSGGQYPSDQGVFGAPGSTKHPLDYNNFTALFEAVLGAEAGGVVTIEDRLAVFNWLELEKTVSRHRFGAAVATKMTLSGQQKGQVELEVEWAPRSFDNNSAVFPAGATGPATMNKVRFQDLVFRIGDQADALASGDRVEIESFEITFDRKMKIDDYVARAANAQLPIQPVEDEKRECGFKFKLPRYAADTIIDWKEADTALQADFVFTRGAESLTVELPEVRITEGFDAPIEGASHLTLEGSLEAYVGGTAYMYTGNEMRITVV